MTSERAGSDRAAAIRQALLEVVAADGLHAATIAKVASRAGVAAGTIYVHHADKETLILATYRQVKRELGRAATAGWDAGRAPRDRFLAAWRRVHAHLRDRPERASFLLQLEASPYARHAHDADDVADVWAAAVDDIRPDLVDLPDDLLYDLAFGPAVGLAASAETDEDLLDAVAAACWRAVTTDDR